MEKLILAFLYSNGYCPLPGLGVLKIHAGSSQALHANHLIKAPIPSIEFFADEVHSVNFINFLSEHLHVNEQEAIQQLTKYCQKLGNLENGQDQHLVSAGKFERNHEGVFRFVSTPLPEAFFPDVPMVRVIHPGSIHQVKVGDTETTSDVMNEYFSEVAPKRKFSWWMAALLLFGLATAIILIYFQQENQGSLWGSNQKLTPAATPSTYRIVN